MSESLLNNKAGGYEVSTIRTDAGGGARSYGGFASSADYEDLNAWPFETMVLKVGSRKGLYHEAYADEESARAGHARVLVAVENQTLVWGQGVQGQNGTPTLTPEDWSAQCEAKAKAADPDWREVDAALQTAVKG